MPFHWIRHILKNEAFTGMLLLFMAMMALVISNSSYATTYENVFSWTFYKSLSYWINHGLMSLFFLQVGLEIKAEILEGELSGIKRALLPGVAALGGMLVPALIFLIVNHAASIFWPAWSVPVATDVAFSLAILQLFGRRVPVGLKLFLLALAIFDDLGAVAIIAVFYTHKIHFLMLLGAVFMLGALAYLNMFQIFCLRCYLIIGLLLWFFIAESGVDAAITGMLLALFIPLHPDPSLLRVLYQKLYPWVTYFILPLFAFANAGVHLANIHLSSLLSSLPLGIILGLVIGKPLGVFGFSYSVIRLNLAKLPAQVTWSHLWGMSFLCGIGFTMSLLLGDLAFQPPQKLLLLGQIKIGILVGSLVAALFGYVWFYVTLREDHGRN